MSVYSARTGLSSILKSYSPADREKTKTAYINKVRFDEPQKRALTDIVKDVVDNENVKVLDDYVGYLRTCEIEDEEFITIINDAQSVLNVLNSNCTKLIEGILILPWTKRSDEAKQKYTDFCVNLLIAQTRYVEFCICNLIGQWIPPSDDPESWLNGTPSEMLKSQLEWVHKLLDRITTAIPMAYNILIETIDTKFPYYKKEEHVVAGYLHNVLWLLKYNPIFMRYAIHMIVQKLIILDVNAPRGEIQNDNDLEEDSDDDNYGEEMFEMEDVKVEDKLNISTMDHPIARTLDTCMEKMFAFFENYKTNFNPSSPNQLSELFALMLNIFDKSILPTHNTHHVQFLIFYFCSFKQAYANMFVGSLFNKLKDPNVPALERQSAVGYMASYLARAKNLSLVTLKYFLKALCDWAHSYINGSDQYRGNVSLKANIVFFSVCQAIFYVIAFRSRCLTTKKNDLEFLQSLQLSSLVTNHLNPLRVCLPAVATTFAGVTRAYQLAYCHAILERNARKKLATVYANGTATAEEVLDTFFPFDPYLLKFSEKRITPNYLQYQASELEETIKTEMHDDTDVEHRKRDGPEIGDDTEMDEFLLAEKRYKLSESAKSVDRDAQFTYGLSPGFHKG